MEAVFWLNEDKNNLKISRLSSTQCFQRKQNLFSSLAMCSNLRLLVEIDAMCSHLPFPRGGKYSPFIAVIIIIATSSVNDGPTWLGKWCLSGKEGDGDYERNEPIKRWVQADTAQRKTTRLQKRVTFNPPVNPQKNCFSWEEMKGVRGDFWTNKIFSDHLDPVEQYPFCTGNVCWSYRRRSVSLFLALKGLTSRDRIEVLKGWWKRGAGQSPHLGKTSWDPAFWRGTGT